MAFVVGDKVYVRDELVSSPGKDYYSEVVTKPCFGTCEMNCISSDDMLKLVEKGEATPCADPANPTLVGPSGFVGRD